MILILITTKYVSKLLIWFFSAQAINRTCERATSHRKRLRGAIEARRRRLHSTHDEGRYTSDAQGHEGGYIRQHREDMPVSRRRVSASFKRLRKRSQKTWPVFSTICKYAYMYNMPSTMHLFLTSTFLTTYDHAK